MVDSWVVGNYVGDAALAAVGIGFPVLFMFTSLFMGLSTGGTVVIAQFYGAGNQKNVSRAVHTAMSGRISEETGCAPSEKNEKFTEDFAFFFRVQGAMMPVYWKMVLLWKGGKIS